MLRRLTVCLVLLALASGFVLSSYPYRAEAQEGSGTLTLTVIGTYQTGIFDEGAAEIVAYDPATRRLFVTNSDANGVDILDISDPTTPTLVINVALDAYGDGINSVAVHNGIVAASIANEEVDGNGQVVFMNTDGQIITAVEVGILPDMVTFTPDGSKVLTANEGEPSDDYATDPEGSVSLIDISGGLEALTQDNVTLISFTDFNTDGARAAELPAEVRIYGPNATVAQDLEPEYIAISPDGTTAFVILQENNALAVIDIASASITAIVALGYKDFSIEGNGIDASNDDDGINIATHPVRAWYLPDAIAAFEANGMAYLISANEGDSRDYDGFSEEADLGELTLDPEAFPNAAELQDEAVAGGLEVTSVNGDTDGDGDYDAVYGFGARSFSIWDTAGNLIFDSGDDFEQITAMLLPEEFNSTNDENGSFEDRSDNAGPEPEGVTVGTIDGVLYAFIIAERIGGVFAYDISDPSAPVFVTYVNNRDFSGDPAAGTAGDLAPECVIFISAEDSPTGSPLLVIANEVSGSTTIYQITKQ